MIGHNHSGDRGHSLIGVSMFLFPISIGIFVVIGGGAGGGG